MYINIHIFIYVDVCNNANILNTVHHQVVFGRTVACFLLYDVIWYILV